MYNQWNYIQKEIKNKKIYKPENGIFDPNDKKQLY